MKELAFFCVLLGVASIPSGVGLSAERSAWHASRFDSGATTPATSAESEDLRQVPNLSELASDTKAISSPPTRSSIMANWDDVAGANGYLLDVSTSDSFSNYVEGYHELDVGKVTGRLVTGLNQGTTYYYRVRPYGGAGAGNYSQVVTATTVPTVGLVIHPTFDSSITNSPKSAIIQATINRAISIYETLFTDPITIEIRFRYAATMPDGTPVSGNSQSLIVVYGRPWNTWINALRADATSGNDNTAIATLPTTALFGGFIAASANGRALGQNTPPAMFANGTVGTGGPYDGIVTLNSASLLQFSRPTDANRFDAQRSIEREIDNIMGLLYSPTHFTPIDLFSWSSAGSRNFENSGRRYFSIDGGVTNIVDYNQNINGSLAGWLSETCPQTHPYVQNAFLCAGQYSDISATSPEGINLDVIGYDLAGTPIAEPYDFNNDAHSDYVLYNSSTQQTAIWYLNNNVLIGSALGPNLPGGWQLVGVADFNRDGHPDYLLYSPVTRQTVIWYMNNNVHSGSAAGPILPGGWNVVALADFNLDGYPDYVLFNANTRGTVIWYMNNNVHTGSATGPTLPGGWSLRAVADFNGDERPDYLLFSPVTRQTVIWYMSGATHTSSATGPTIVAGWEVVGTADFDRNARPDYVLYNSGSHQTAIWYLNNNIFLRNAGGPTLPAGWTLMAP